LRYEAATPALRSRCTCCLPQALGKPAEALGTHEAALRVRRKALGPEHPDVAMSLNNLGNVLYVSLQNGGAGKCVSDA
jgi:hypothetical protein